MLYVKLVSAFSRIMHTKYVYDYEERDMVSKLQDATPVDILQNRYVELFAELTMSCELFPIIRSVIFIQSV